MGGQGWCSHRQGVPLAQAQHRPEPQALDVEEAKGHGGGVWEMQGGEGVRPTGREESGRHAASLEVAEGFCTGSPAPGVRTS